MKTRKTIIATHGTLAEGFAAALKIIVGEDANMIVMNCYMSPDFKLDESIKSLMNSIDFSKEEVVVFTDLLGGSVNNGFIRAMEKYPFVLITNTNLGVLMDYMITVPELSDIHTRVTEQGFNIVCCNDLMQQTVGNTTEDDL
ncbi:MAG: hypothetical protein LKF79_03195 [Solobacterium sp.]|nr:hypothetical protein [Solobacterium sp.]MCH4222153.1 hypothetical protein [Solobacterium sp.]MCH4265633.1 hypothetical protein [Solobacterium sp.]